MTPVTKGTTVGAAPKAAKKFKRVTVEDLERLVVKIGRQLGDDRLDVESQVACLRQFQKVGPKQFGPILNTIFEARRKFFLAKFPKFGVPAALVADWDRASVGKPSGKVFAEAGELIAKAKAKLPICRCGRHERTYVRDGEFYDTCWECAKERKDDRRDVQRVPARLAAPSAADHAAIIGSPRQVLMTAIIGFGGPSSATVKSPRRRKANGPRVFGDKRDAGERRAYMKHEEFKRYGAKKYHGECELA